MADAGKDNDQSMEDILQSIKRIIADEGEPAPNLPGSDVLELTELLAEDAAPPAAPVTAPVPTPKSAQDDIDALFAAAPAAPEPEPEPMATAPEPLMSAPEPVETPVMETAAAAAPPATPAPVATSEGLMSREALAASAAALHALANKADALSNPSHVFRSGTTVEDLVIEALKPMLKEWLDGNLPSMVRTMVEREIRRLSGF